MRRAALFLLFFCPATAFAADCPAAGKAVRDGLAAKLGTPEAEASLRRAIELCPELTEAHYNLALSLLEAGRPADALTPLNQAIKLKPESNFYVALGNAQVQLAKLDDALRSYEQALKLSPENALALQGLSAVYLKNGNATQAEEVLRRAVQISPDDASVFFNLGLVLERGGRLDEAAESYRAAVDRDSSFAAAYTRLGGALSQLGKLDESERALRSAALHAPKDPMVWLALSSVLERKKDYVGGFAAVEKARVLDPESVDVAVSRGILLTKQGRHDEGLVVLLQCADKHPNSAEAQAALGWAQLQSRDLEKAEAALQRALELNTADALSLNNLGVLFQLKGQPEQAKRAFERAGWRNGQFPAIPSHPAISGYEFRHLPGGYLPVSRLIECCTQFYHSKKYPPIWKVQWQPSCSLQQILLQKTGHFATGRYFQSPKTAPYFHSWAPPTAATEPPLSHSRIFGAGHLLASARAPDSARWH